MDATARTSSNVALFLDMGGLKFWGLRASVSRM